MTHAAHTGQKKKKGFLGKIMEKLDKKLEEKSKNTSCCGGAGQDKGKGSSCC